MSEAAKQLMGIMGGDLTQEKLRPEARQAHLNAKIDPATGLPGLHRGPGVARDHRNEWHDRATVGRVDEQPWHRMAAFMLLAGRTNSEIAMAANVSTQCVSDLRAQRWFHELLGVLANETGQDIRAAVDSYAMEALEGIVDIARNGESERARLQACNILLEHSQGKPVQKILSSNVTRTYASVEDEASAIDEELRLLREARARPVISLPEQPTEASTPTS